MDAKQVTVNIFFPSPENQSADPRCEILAYLHAHPHAADSLEGIINWWLPRQRYETTRAVIQKTLDELRREGILEHVSLNNGVYLYRLVSHPEAEH